MTTAPSERFRSYMGPGDKNLPMSNEIQGYQPVSRIGETVINCFVDAYEFAALDNSITHLELTGEREDPDPALAAGAYEPGKDIEVKPHFHEWASVLPGMICLSRKARNSTFRNYVAAETATPVIGCAACLKYDDMDNFYFAGVCRSKTVRPIDDGVGPQVDEFFTLAIGGMVTMLNNSSEPVFPGDMLEYAAAASAPSFRVSLPCAPTFGVRAAARTVRASPPCLRDARAATTRGSREEWRA